MAVLDETVYCENMGLDTSHIPSLQQEALRIAGKLTHEDLPEFWRDAYANGLDDVLGIMKDTIHGADAIRLEFPERQTLHTSRFDGLLRTMGVDSAKAGIVAAEIPQSAISSVLALPGPVSVSEYEPHLWLQVKTGEEPSVIMFDRANASASNPNGVTEVESKGSWVGFSLGAISIEGF